jgi:hypothetical protein
VVVSFLTLRQSPWEINLDSLVAEFISVLVGNRHRPKGEDRMTEKPLSQEVLAAIIKVAGKWAIGMATTPSNVTKQPPQPSQLSDELAEDYDWAFNFLITETKAFMQIESSQ